MRVSALVIIATGDEDMIETLISDAEAIEATAARIERLAAGIDHEAFDAAAVAAMRALQELSALAAGVVLERWLAPPVGAAD